MSPIARSLARSCCGSSEICGSSPSAGERFFAAADAATDAIYASDDPDEIRGLADELVGLLPRHARLSADRTIAERGARRGDDVLELANMLIDLRHRYERLDVEIDALRDRAAAAVAASPPSPTLPLAPGPLHVL